MSARILVQHTVSVAAGDDTVWCIAEAGGDTSARATSQTNVLANNKLTNFISAMYVRPAEQVKAVKHVSDNLRFSLTFHRLEGL